MNEIYVADPAACASSSDLYSIMQGFGPYAGRYLANYPSEWTTLIQRRLASVGDVEALRMKTLLRRAREKSILIERLPFPWNPASDWLSNATKLIANKPPKVNGIIGVESSPPNIFHIHDLDLPPTAEERIRGLASSYLRVSEIFILQSPEIYLIDPYLNPLSPKYVNTLRLMFAAAARGRSQSIRLWTRSSELFRNGDKATMVHDLNRTLRDLCRHAKFQSGYQIELVCVADDTCASKMHDRYLLSIKGGIRFSQGFQELPQGREVDVSPLGGTVHNSLLRIFLEGEHDMTITDRIVVTA